MLPLYGVLNWQELDSFETSRFESSHTYVISISVNIYAAALMHNIMFGRVKN